MILPPWCPVTFGGWVIHLPVGDLVFCHWSTKSCPQVNSFTSGKHSQCCGLRAWHSPKTQRFVTLRWLQEMPSRSVNSNVSLSWHFLKISAVFNAVLRCFIWGNCVPSDMKQTAKQFPHHSASSRSWVQLFKPIFPFSQCTCQEPTLEQKIRANGGWGEQKLTQTFDLNLTESQAKP